MSTLTSARRASAATAACAARSPAPPSGPRLAVFRSNRGIFAQLVDDADRQDARAAPAGSTCQGLKGDKTDQARRSARLLAAAAKKAGIETVVFDRGGYLYHGRVKALAEGAREGGLKF